MYPIKEALNKAAAGLLILFVLLSTGCWDRREVDTLALILGAGVDYLPEEDQIIYTTLTARPGQLAGIQDGGGGQFFMGPIWVSQSTGKTIFEASRNLSTRTPRHIFESHIVAIIVGEELARRGMGELVDFMIRDREHRIIHPIFIVRGSAGEVIKAEPEIESNIAQEVIAILESQNDLSTTPFMSLKDFLVPLSRPGSDAFAPVIELRERTPTPDEEFLTGAPEDRVKKYLAVQGTAVFSEDKLAGYLDVPETKGLLWVRGEVVRTNLIPRQPDEGQVTVYITRSNSKLEPEFVDDKLKIKIQVEAEGDIASSTIKQDIADSQVIEELEKTLANNIKQEILLAVNKSKELQSDFLCFGAALRRKDFRRWKNIEADWRKKLPEVEVEIRAMVEIRRTGIISTPAIRE